MQFLSHNLHSAVTGKLQKYAVFREELVRI
jgi:hypothetical protein